MWKPKLDVGPEGAPGNRTNHGVMAHRRAVGGRKVLAVGLLVLASAILLAGSVYISNRVTGLRTEIAGLESRREFLEAGSAGLLTVWNKATAPAVVTARAQRELGLIVPAEPGLVLVRVPEYEQRVSPWRRLLDNMGGGAAAQAAEVVPNRIMGSMVSLRPRQVRAGGAD